MKNVNMFVTNILTKGDSFGTYADLRFNYGKKFRFNNQIFKEFDQYLILEKKICQN